MENKQDNVIEFPVQKKVVGESTASSLISRLNAKWVIGSLLSITLAVPLANSFLIPSGVGTSDSARGLASLGDGIQYDRNTDWEHDLARQLAETPSRGIASVGHAPSVEEKLRFGTLEGKYAIRFDSGKVSEIEFTPWGGEADRPKYVNDRLQFIKSHRSLFPEGSLSASNVKHEKAADRVWETYSLTGKGEGTVAEVKFELDIYGRLLSMKVDPR